MITRATTPVTRISWSADWQALSFRFCPRYWEATTAPPVATAAKILIISTLIMSTKETPEVAASPAAGYHHSVYHTNGNRQYLFNDQRKDQLFQIISGKKSPHSFCFPHCFLFCIIIFHALLSFHFPGYPKQSSLL